MPSCPKCKHPVSARMVRCVYCGTTVVRADKLPVRQCPRCRLPMKPETVQWIMIDRCTTCRGEFYDVKEIDQVVLDSADERAWLDRTREARRPDSADGMALTCPGCSSSMRTFTVPGEPPVVIDVCRSCQGTWLDRGEAARLKASARKRIVPKTVSGAVIPAPQKEEVVELESPEGMLDGLVRKLKRIFE